uniref:ABC transporter, substrate binding protein (Sugar) n=1 Tax=uncultured organism TaxID=155900 RepID=M1QAZ2_9ZZZZ|nr:ABC transporter, substrate binding protein (sugar) [uncultured organism]
MLLVPMGIVAQGQGKTIITFSNWQFLEPSRGEVLHNFIEQFEENNPNIRVETTAIPYSNYSSAILSQLQAGAGPDIMFTKGTDFLSWMRTDRFAPLNDHIDISKYEDEFIPQQELAKQNGNVYGIAYEGFPYGALIYNKAWLDEAGVGVPTTPEELLNASNAVVEETDATYGLIHPTNVGNRSYLMQGGMIVINGFGGRIIAEKDGEKVWGVTEPEFVEGVEFLKEIYDSPGTPKGTPFGRQRNAYLNGQAAMVLDGSYWPAIVKGESEELYENIGVAPIPFPTIASPFEFNLYAINANSDKKEAAAKFLEFLLAPEQANKWAKESAIPGLKFTYDAVIEKYPWFEVYAEASEKGVPKAVEGHYADSLEIRNLVADYIGRAMMGELPVEEAMERCKQELQNQFGDA